MSKKIGTAILIFIISTFLIVGNVNAQTMGELTRLATDNLDEFFTTYIEGITNGNTDSGGKTHANYCMDPFDHGWANHGNMITSVVDVGANGMSSVNGLSTTDSEGARRAMEVLYYATKSYQNQEPWGKSERSPWRLMMMQTSAMYSGVITGAGLFNNLPGGVDEDYMIYQFGGNIYHELKAEGENYVDSTMNYAFKDNSTKDIQTIEENGDWVFVGPYSIQNTGKGYISEITVTTMDGQICTPDGWSTSTESGSVNWDFNLPNGTQFYLAFHNQKPDSAEKVIVKKTVDGILRARMVFFESDGGQNMATYGGRLDSSTSTDVIELPKVPFTNIKLSKIDQDSKQPLKNVGFMVYNETLGKWVQDGVPAKYVDSKKEATTYRTDDKGEVTIRNLSKKGNYKIYEVVNPNFGYMETSVENPCQEITVEVKAIGQSIPKTIANKRQYVKLSGYAWEDIASGKQAQLNQVYSESDKDQRLRNITVTLKKANGEIIDTRVTNTITNTRNEKEKGAYLFGDYQRDSRAKRIKIEDLKGAYIEFEYNGMCYQSVEVRPNAQNGNKATDKAERPRFNNEYATITKGKAQNGNHTLNYDYNSHKATLKYGGNYLYGYHKDIYQDDNAIQKYPIRGIDKQYLLKANTLTAAPNYLLGQAQYSINDIYTKGIEEVENINLGLREREMPDISLVQDIEKTTISLNGYHHTYEYAKRFEQLNQQIEQFNKEHPNDGEIFNIGVNFGTKYGPNSYTTTMYSSDIVYKAEDEKGNLNVSIQYKIALRNEASSVKTVVNQLYNYFDQDYDASRIKVEDENRKELKYTLDNSYQEGGRRRILIQPEGGIKINNNATRYIYITYPLKDEAIIKILNQDKTLDSITEVVSYSSYDDSNFKSRYAGIDRDSEPNNSTIGNKNTYEDDIDQAPSLILKSNATRIIQGSVWHENVIDSLLKDNVIGFNRQRIGNGQYEAGIEKVIKDVQVDLLKVNEDKSLTPTRLYQTVGKNKTRTIVETSEKRMQTNELGEYSFVGVIPGKYVIRFTYKNNSIICNTDGSPFKTLEEAEGGVEYYKSTLHRTKRNNDGSLNTSAYDNNKNNLYWYTSETKGADRLSDAKDNEALVTKRTSVKEINYSKAEETSKITEISSDTSQFEIRLDCNADDLKNVSKYGQALKYVFDNIDFGIVRRPKQDLILKKEVSYVEVVLANGQVIIKGDPRKDKLENLKFLPNGDIHIELDNEIMQGATLKLTYEITVDNRKCEIDYNDKNYYYFGKVQKDNKGTPINWKIATITDLFDYPSNGLNFDQQNNAVDKYGKPIWNYLKLSELGSGRLEEGLAEKLANTNVILHTTAFKDMRPGEIQKEHMVLTRLLANVDDEFSFDNDLEVNTYEGRKIDHTTPGNYDPTDSSTSENDDDHKNVVITGPTGENQEYLPYIIVGITSFVILAVGIILIKRKV